VKELVEKIDFLFCNFDDKQYTNYCNIELKANFDNLMIRLKGIINYFVIIFKDINLKS